MKSKKKYILILSLFIYYHSFAQTNDDTENTYRTVYIGTWSAVTKDFAYVKELVLNDDSSYAWTKVRQQGVFTDKGIWRLQNGIIRFYLPLYKNYDTEFAEYDVKKGKLKIFFTDIFNKSHVFKLVKSK